LTDPIPALRVRDLEVVYQRGGEPAAQGVSFELGAGEGLLITGDHGAGKTSVLRALLGLVRATGVIELLGGRPGDIAVQRSVGYAPEGRTFTERHSPLEIVGVVSAIRVGRRSGDVVDDALERAGVPPDRRNARGLDVEEIRRTAMACAIAADPVVLVLDDPWEFAETEREIARARARGATVVVATHDPGGFPALLDRTLTLVDGRPE
jgi:ABC-type multidrug transport system ATPase subunit